MTNAHDAWREFANDMGLTHSTRPEYVAVIVDFITSGYLRGAGSKEFPVSHWDVFSNVPLNIHFKIYLTNGQYFTISWWDNELYETGYLLYGHLPYTPSLGDLCGGMFPLESFWLIADYALNQFDLDFDSLRLNTPD